MASSPMAVLPQYATQSRTEVPASSRFLAPESFSKFLSLPQEVLQKIYKEFFTGLALHPDVAAPACENNCHTVQADKKRTMWRHSRIALLLLCKSQKEYIERAIWESAYVSFTCPRHIAQFTLGRYASHMITHIHLCVAGCEAVPFLLLSKFLRMLTSLKVLGLSSLTPNLRYKHKTFLAEAEDPTSDLTLCISPTFLTRGVVRSSYSHVWGPELLDPRTFEDRKSVPKIITMLNFKRRREHTLDSESTDDFEEFEVIAKFDSESCCIYGEHLGIPFWIPQTKLKEQLATFHKPPKHIMQGIMLDHSEREVDLWKIVDGFGSDIVLTPHKLLGLYNKHERAMDFWHVFEDGDDHHDRPNAEAQQDSDDATDSNDGDSGDVVEDDEDDGDGDDDDDDDDDDEDDEDDGDEDDEDDGDEDDEDDGDDGDDEGDEGDEVDEEWANKMYEHAYDVPPMVDEETEQEKIERRRKNRMYTIAEVLLTPEWFVCGCESTRSKADTLAPLHWEIWRRILNVKDKMVLNRPWRYAHEIVRRMDQAAEPPRGMSFNQQEVFFRRLFDPSSKWMEY